MERGKNGLLWGLIVVVLATSIWLEYNSHRSLNIENEVGEAPDGDDPGSALPVDVKPPEIANALMATVETEEARLAVMSLVRENRNLRKENLALKKEVRILTHSLHENASNNEAKNVAKTPILRVSAPIQPLAGVSSLSACLVRDVSRDLNMVVLDCGEEGGVAAGAEFDVLRGRRRVARVRAIDVRERLAGALILSVENGFYPQSGDSAAAVTMTQ